MYANELQDFEYLKLQYEKEDLHQVFGTPLDCFPNITGATVTGNVYLWDTLHRIKYNLAYDIDAQTLILPKYVDGKKNTDYDRKKESLPAVCYNAGFNGYKNTENLKKINNIMFLDIDDFQTKEQALEYKKEIIEKYNWIIACNLSLSRLGLHVIALVDKIHDSKDYTNKYGFISSTYFDNRLDKSSNKLTQYTVLPFDYDIYINESPEVLHIDQIFEEHNKSIRSAYINNDEFQYSIVPDTGIRSAYIQDDNNLSSELEKGIRSAHKEKEIICTPYTFFTDSPLNHVMNDAARKHGLKFKLDIDESYFVDPNIPLYYRDGIDVMEVNLFTLRGGKVYDGNRHNFIGAITVKMLYLNAVDPVVPIKKVREDILKFIFHINKNVCEPPMTNDEVLKSYNANWKRYKDGLIDFSKYFIKKRAFWSQHSTLSANEKRKVTCRVKNEPTVEDTKRRIWEAIEQISADNKKLCQSAVAKASGLSVSTIKKYRKYYWECVEMLNPGSVKSRNPKNALKQSTALTAGAENKSIMDEPFETIALGVIDLLDIEPGLTEEEKIKNPQDYTDEELRSLFQRLFPALYKDMEKEGNDGYYTRFVAEFHHLPPDSAELLYTPAEQIDDESDFWRQSVLISTLLSALVEV
jgi:hypothetical protein